MTFSHVIRENLKQIAKNFLEDIVDPATFETKKLLRNLQIEENPMNLNKK